MSNLSRRSALVLGATSMAPGIGHTRSQEVDALTLQADLERYVAFGVHQSGSLGDLATGAWISERLTASGFSVSNQAVDVPFFNQKIASLTLANGTELHGIGQHPVSTTPSAGLRTALSLWRDARDSKSLAGKIAILILPFGRHSSALHPAISVPIQIALDNGAVGIALVTDGPSGEALALNATDVAMQRPVPAIVLGSRGIKPLLDAAGAGEVGHLRVEGEVGRRTAFNIVGRRTGSGKEIVVTTPLSGWFTCGAERGSGVAAFLALTDWLAHRFPDFSITVGGMSGHEFENLGSKKFNSTEIPNRAQIALWVHLGAAFAARDWHEVGPGLMSPLPNMDSSHFLIAHTQFLPILRRTMQGVPGLEVPYEAKIENAAGEAKQILIDGHTRLIANFGSHRLHHARNDGVNATSGGLIFQAYRGLESALEEILG